MYASLLPVRQNGRERRYLGFTLKSMLTCDHLVKDRAEREDVGAGIHLCALCLVWRHIDHRTDYGAVFRLRLHCRPRNEIGRAGSASFATPKSSIFTTPLSVTITFAGLRSR
jgi:hypothetical protein